MSSQRYKLTIAYRGTHYHGWQWQSPTKYYKGPTPPAGHGIPTIQGVLERAVQYVVGHPINLVGSSRTDSGVHAKGQIAHFDTDKSQIPADALRRALNHALPDDINVLKIEPVPDTFLATMSTVSKRYQYAVWNHLDRPTFFGDLVWHRWQEIDFSRIRDAAPRFVGEHDFASFCRPGHKRESTVRTVLSCDVSRRGPLIVFGVEGTGFLWNMVRIMVGTMIEIGMGIREPADIETMLAAKDRRAAGYTAPPHGLYLQWIKTSETPRESAFADEAPISTSSRKEVVRKHRGQYTNHILEIARTLTGDDKWFTARAMEQLRADAQTQRGLIAFVAGEPAGFLLWNAKDKIGQITWMGVRPQNHRQGIARRMTARLERHLAAANIKELHVEAPGPAMGDPLHGPALAFYRAVGFESIQRIPQPHHTDSPGVLVLGKSLIPTA